jgi:hypothetical protein
VDLGANRRVPESGLLYWTPKFGPRNKLEFSAESLT